MYSYKYICIKIHIVLCAINYDMFSFVLNFTKIFIAIYWTDLMGNENVLTQCLCLHKQWNNVNLEMRGALWASQVPLVVKNPPANAGDT